MCFSIELNSNLLEIAKNYNAKIFNPSFINMNQLLEQKCESTKILKKWDDQDRIFPNSFAPVIAQNKDQKNIFFMRYRIRPSGSKEEVPTKFNLYNARVDSLTSKETWKNLFMKKHGLIIMKSFFEWVKNDKNLSCLVNFLPRNHEDMLVPCIFDNWKSEDGMIKYSSFAIITDDPPNEILEKKHDRCPVFIKKENMNMWLNPKGYNQEEILNLLRNKQDTQYECLNIY